MNDDQKQPLIEAWFSDREVAPQNVHEGVARVMSEVARTRQHGRWLPLPLHRPEASSPTAADTTEYQPSPIPASNGHTPTVIGRTSPMLSPVKAITAGAIVFAIGSAFLVAQPLGQQGSVPGAEAEAIAPTWITGTIAAAPSCSSPDMEVRDGVLRQTNMECSPQAWTSADPRLSGEVVRRWSEDVYQTEEGTFSISVDTPYLRNDGGAWACRDTTLLRGSQMSSEPLTGSTFTCTGEGGYEGLSAILVSETTTGFNEEFVGLIFSGDFPPLPEPPVTE